MTEVSADNLPLRADGYCTTSWILDAVKRCCMRRARKTPRFPDPLFPIANAMLSALPR